MFDRFRRDIRRQVNDAADRIEDEIYGQTRAERIQSNIEGAFRDFGRTLENLTQSPQGIALICVAALIALAIAAYLIVNAAYIAGALISGVGSLVGKIAPVGFSALSTVASAGYGLLGKAATSALPVAMNLPWLYIGGAAVALGASYFLYKKLAPTFHGANRQSSSEVSFKQKLDKLLERGEINNAVTYALSHENADFSSSAHLILGEKLAKRATTQQVAYGEFKKVAKTSPSYGRARFEMANLCDKLGGRYTAKKFSQTLKSGGFDDKEVRTNLVRQLHTL